MAALSAPPAAGQVVVDDSFGAPGAVLPGVDPNGESADYLIRGDLGEQRGGSLFHSFSEFSIGSGETATFTDQGLAADRPAIRNVISRVTGGSESRIDGMLRSTIDGADVWLLNPAGVVFGAGARLDVPGGFHASTADELAFDTGEKLEVRLGGTVPILDVAAPASFGFLGANAARLEVHEGAVLSVGGASLALEGRGEVGIGGELTADGGSGGHVTLRGETIDVADSALVAADGDLGGGQVFLDAGSRITVRGIVSATGESGGEIGIRSDQGTVSVEDSGRVSADARGISRSAPAPNPGRIEVSGAAVTVNGTVSASGARDTGDDRVSSPGVILLSARDWLRLTGSAEVLAEGSPNLDRAATITLSGGRVSVEEGARVSVDSLFRIAGHVRVDALDGDLVVAGEASADALGDGKSGSVVLDGRGDVTVSGTLSAGGDGDGVVTIVADGAVDLSSSASVVATGIDRDGGAVTIASRGAGPISISGVIDVSSTESGGALTLFTAGDLELSGLIDGTGVIPFDRSFVSLGADRILLDGALITAARSVTTLEARIVRIDSSVVSASGFPSFNARRRSDGRDVFVFPRRAGSVVVTADQVHLGNSSRIEATSFRGGTGGDIRVTARTLRLDGASINAKTAVEGAGGDIVISVNQLILESGSSISTESAPVDSQDIAFYREVLSRGFTDIAFVTAPVSTGDAGSVEVNAKNVRIEDRSRISARALAANGGNVTFTVTEGLHLVDSAITADVGDGAGGNITIDPVFVVLESSQLLARAGAGRGGEIRLTSEAFIVDPRSVVDASSEAGPQLDGIVEIDAPDVDLAGSLAQLPASVLDASSLAAQRCAARRTGETGGSFVVSGRDGAPAGPEGLLPAGPDAAAGSFEAPGRPFAGSGCR